MIAISNHVWGVSKAQDRVWMLVNGFRPSKAGARILMTLQACIDESFDENGVFVLGGCIASAQSWGSFSGEWERILPSTKLVNKNGDFYFKMAEIALSEEKMSTCVPGFFQVIEEYAFGFISAKITQPELKRARARIVVPGVNIDWGTYANPWYITFRCLLDKFHLGRTDQTMHEALSDEKIDFIFDERAEKKEILTGWDNYIKNREEEIKKYYGASPIFRDDSEFLPLQAADYWAWWMRKWYNDGTPENADKFDFGFFTGKKTRKHLYVKIEFNEDNLVESLIKTIRKQIGAQYLIYDVKLI